MNKRRNMKKILTSFVSFLLITAFMGTFAFAGMPTAINAQSLKGQADTLPKVIGYKAYTNHQGPVDSSGEDNKFVYLDVYYDSSITIQSSEAVVSQVNITYGGVALNSTTTVSIGDDGKTLHFEMQFPFAGMYGNLAVQSVLDGNNTLTAVKKAGSDTSVNFPEVYLIVSNGILLDTVSQSAGTTSESAFVTKKVNQLPSATRGAVQFIFLKDGKTVGTVNANGSNLVAHFHMYLSLDAETYCSYIESAFNRLNVVGGIFEGYTVKREGANLTITANQAVAGEVLDLIPLAYPNDRNTYADKSVLSEAVTEAEKLIANNTGKYPDLENETAIANAYVDCIYYTQEQVDVEAQKVKETLAVIYTRTLAFSYADTITGILINANPGVVPYGTTLLVKTLTSGESYEAVRELLSSEFSKYTVLDFSLINQNIKVEPNGAVNVSIPLPEGYPDLAEQLALYHIVDGKKVPVAFTLSDKKILFTAESFSPYAIADLSVNKTVIEKESVTEDISVPVAEDISSPVTASVTEAVPTTGDATAAYLYMCLAVLAVLIGSFSGRSILPSRKK